MRRRWMQVRDHIDVRALRVAEYLGEEYERGYKGYNEVYRRFVWMRYAESAELCTGFFCGG